MFSGAMSPLRGAFAGFQEDDDGTSYPDIQIVLFDSPCKWSNGCSESDSCDSGFGSPVSFFEVACRKRSCDDEDDEVDDVDYASPFKRSRLHVYPTVADCTDDLTTVAVLRNDLTIAAVERLQASDENLVGDGTRTHSLPHTETATHRDLKLVTPATVVRLMQAECGDSNFRIVDCRYPYEFAGGHIQGAVNIYTEEGIDGLLRDSTSRPSVLVFHCEFSSERGPKLMRHLRNEDRRANSHCYPALHFPEIYLIEGGYKAFYNANKVMCEPAGYVPMHHVNHSTDLKTFRSRSKSWSTRTRKSKRMLASRSSSSPDVATCPDAAILCFSMDEC